MKEMYCCLHFSHLSLFLPPPFSLSSLISSLPSGLWPTSSEWHEDGICSKPIPPAWPLHTATLCWQPNHLLKGTKCCLWQLLLILQSQQNFISVSQNETVFHCLLPYMISFDIIKGGKSSGLENVLNLYYQSSGLCFIFHIMLPQLRS